MVRESAAFQATQIHELNRQVEVLSQEVGELHDGLEDVRAGADEPPHQGPPASTHDMVTQDTAGPVGNAHSAVGGAHAVPFHRDMPCGAAPAFGAVPTSNFTQPPHPPTVHDPYSFPAGSSPDLNRPAAVAPSIWDAPLPGLQSAEPAFGTMPFQRELCTSMTVDTPPRASPVAAVPINLRSAGMAPHYAQASTSDTSVCQVNVLGEGSGPSVGAGGGSEHTLDPLVRAELLKRISKPKWDGNTDSWPEFFLRWKEYFALAAEGIPYNFLPHLLYDSLPTVNADLYRSLVQQGWSYQQIILDLDSQHRGLRNRLVDKAAWQNFVFSGKDDGYASYHLWYTKWRLLAERVDRLTPDDLSEEYLKGAPVAVRDLALGRIA